MALCSSMWDRQNSLSSIPLLEIVHEGLAGGDDDLSPTPRVHVKNLRCTCNLSTGERETDP